MTSQQTPSEAPLEDEFPLYDPTPSGPGAPSDNPSPDSQLVPGTSGHSAHPAVDQRPTPMNRRNLLALVGAGAVGLTGVGFLVNKPAGDRTGTLALPEALTSFQLEVTSGRVTIRGTDGAAAGSWSGGSVREPEIDRSGDAATVTATDGSDLTLELPTGSTVEVRTTSGDVRVTDVDLATLTVGTTSGDVEVTDTAPGSLTANTTSGDVDLRLSQPPDAVSVTTTSGEVEIRLPGRGYRYETDTRSGDVDLPDNSGDVPISVRTTSGDIEVEED